MWQVPDLITGAHAWVTPAQSAAKRTFPGAGYADYFHHERPLSHRLVGPGRGGYSLSQIRDCKHEHTSPIGEVASTAEALLDRQSHSHVSLERSRPYSDS